MKKPSSQQPATGFILVITISMMVLMVVVGLGLMSLSAISLRTASAGQAQQEAQANARLALMIAIGQLQSAAGPDQRITARGGSLANHPALETTVSPNSPQAFWVGAASSDPGELIGAEQKPVIWLISGLNPQASASAQIGGSAFIGGVVNLFGSGSINLDQTGGLPITAGLVPVSDRASGRVSGSYAYFVDDEGMKAQLVASHPDLVNGNGEVVSTVIPGSYDPSILNGMSGLEGRSNGDYLKLISINSLPLLGNQGVQVAHDKRMAYTTRSHGVLSDVKRGGLKKDLTIAFEKHTVSQLQKFGYTYQNMPDYPVYDAIFEKTSGSEWGDYLLLDESRRGEFGQHGYIHWGMLRDYYNMKRYITRIDGRDTLAPFAIRHGNTHGAGFNPPYGRGIVPPHSIGTEGGMPSQHVGMPYGDVNVTPLNANSTNIHELNREFFKHSPLTPLLGQIQFNLWLEKDTATNPSRPDVTEVLRLCNQMFVSHYNPYNINLQFNQGDNSFQYSFLPRTEAIILRGQVGGLGRDYGHQGNWLDGWDPNTRDIRLCSMSHSYEGRRYRVRTAEHLGPGRAMFCGFQDDAKLGTADYNFVYGTNVRDVVNEKVFTEYEIIGPLPPEIRWEVNFAAGDTGVPGASGLDSQILWDFYRKGDGPQGRLEFKDLQPSTYNDNTMLRHSIRLRTTKEEDSSIRPLVDANIRAFYMNRRWDQPLVDGIAAYTMVGSTDQTGSGDIMSQIPQMSTQADGKGYGYWGAEHDSFLGNDRVILFDVPREDLVSLGQLQHANVGRFSYEPSYIIGNSYANPRIPRGDWKTMLTDTTNTNIRIPQPYAIYDASYLVNEALWDGYTFTTIPQVADNYNDSEEPEPSDELFTRLFSRELFLPNPRYIPYQPSGSAFDMATLQADEAVHYNAGHILVDGSFNVNSTSVDAWEAFLSGTHGMPYQKIDGNGNIVGFEPMAEERVRFPRVQSVFGDEMTSNNPDENYWVGFRALEQEEVRELAEAIVEEIRERGPFLSMAEFVNRKLENGEHGQMGALQAALDKTVNANVSSDFTSNATHPNLPPNAKQAAGFPGQLLQGDILQALAPSMSVRSDTFTIRAYGESLDPVSGTVQARAWCEAIVQRYPDPVSVDDEQDPLIELAQPTSRFGRRFHIVGFRWLNQNEI